MPITEPKGKRRDRCARSGTQAARLALTVAGLLAVGVAIWVVRGQPTGGLSDVQPLYALRKSQHPATDRSPMEAGRSPLAPFGRSFMGQWLGTPTDHEPLRPSRRSETARAPRISQPDGPRRVPQPKRSKGRANDRLPRFNGRPIRPARRIPMLVTAYSPDERSCGRFADNVTASGYSVWTNGMKLVAADEELLPFGAIVTVPGYDDGHPVPVLDRGGKIEGRRLDVLMPTHQRAKRWGAQWITVTVWEYADQNDQ